MSTYSSELFNILFSKILDERRGPNINNILLPDVLYYIFDYLDLNERKTASKVCRLWNEILFSPKYLQNVKFNLGIEGCYGRDSLEFPYDSGDIISYRTEKILNNTTRRYKSVVIRYIFDYEGKGRQLIIEFIKKIASSLKSVTLDYNCRFSEQFLYHMICQAPNLEELIIEQRPIVKVKYEKYSKHENVIIPRLENLKTFEAFACTFGKTITTNIISAAPNIENISLTNFELKDFLCILHCKTNLKCLNLNMLNMLLEDEDEYELQLQTLFKSSFEYLNQLTLTFNSYFFDLYDINLFKMFILNHSKTLKVLKLSEITEEMCRAIFDTCSFLNELHIKLTYMSLDENFYNITFLDNLTTLTLERKTDCSRDIYIFEKIFMSKKYSKNLFKKLENLELKYIDVNLEKIEALIKNMPYLKKLMIQDVNHDDVCFKEICEMCRAIFDTCSFLNELHVMLYKYTYSNITFCNIKFHDNLTTLTLEQETDWLREVDAAFEKIFMPKLENLELKNIDVDLEKFEALIKNMPNLKKLMIKDLRLDKVCFKEICKTLNNSQLDTIILQDTKFTQPSISGLMPIKTLKNLYLYGQHFKF